MSYARVIPSKLHLTVPCPGSLQLQEQAARNPTPPTEEQAEGTLGHLVAMKYAIGAGMEWPLGRKVTVGGHEFEIDDDMVDGATIYSEEAQPGGRFENPVAMPDIHPMEAIGTPDYWNLIESSLNTRRLKVVEYKYGHRFVEVFEHYQLIANAAGVARFLNLPLDLPVILCVVQPRNYTHGAVRKHKMTVGEVYKFCAEVIAPRVQLALQPNPPTYVGRHCMDCQARHLCKTLQTATANIVDFSGMAEVREMPDAAVGAELRILKEAIKLLEGRYTGLYQHASSLARTGHAIAHWSMQPSAGKLRWKEGVTPDKIAGMGDLFGLNLRKPLEVLTPTQCIRAGVDKGIIDGDYAHRPTGAMRLVPDDTVRTRKIFGDNRT